ncbi:MAG: very short patch repair endonuclease [Actinomycetota bacterium]|nr:very short patch repair endonuclease [Actinomycetota bacterium]
MTAVPRPTFAETPESVRAIMRGNKSRDTRPEIALRSELHRLGWRFRKDFRIDEGRRGIRADVVFTRQRVAVFVDGCFWHACPTHGHVPKANNDYWRPKLARNVERDGRNNALLEAAGWTVIRIWEHDPLDVAMSRVAHALNGRRRARDGHRARGAASENQGALAASGNRSSSRGCWNS